MASIYKQNLKKPIGEKDNRLTTGVHQTYSINIVLKGHITVTEMDKHSDKTEIESFRRQLGGNIELGIQIYTNNNRILRTFERKRRVCTHIGVCMHAYKQIEAVNVCVSICDWGT